MTALANAHQRRTEPYPQVDLREQRLRHAGLFRGLARDTVDAVIPKFEFLDVRNRDHIFRQGEPGRDLYVIIEGSVKLGRSADDGRVRLVAVLGASEQFGELGAFDVGPRTASAIALSDTTLAKLSGAELQEWVRVRPELGLHLLRVVSRRLRRANTLVSDTVFVDVPGRLAKQLLEFARARGTVRAGEVHVPFELNQQELGQLLGASRETVNKALADFATRGWIRVESKTVHIIQPKRLAARAGLVTSAQVARP
jgi:CRP/FNR family transcriptional regulator, cyclic AMP receptor protein